MTVGGLLRIDEVDRADVIHLGDRPIPLDGLRAHLVSQLPKEGPAEFVIYYVWSGCANCGVEYFLLDAGAESPQPLYITHSPYDESDEPEVESYEPGVITISRAARETTLLGDGIMDLVQYKRGDKALTLLRHSAVADYQKFDGQEIASLMSDTEARYTLVELMGMRAFGEFRRFIHESGENIDLIDQRYLVGTGNGNDHGPDRRYSLFIIDTYFDRAWALQCDSHDDVPVQTSCKNWGTLSKEDTVVRELLDNWLASFGKKLALQEGAIEIVDAPPSNPRVGPLLRPRP